MSDSPNVRNIRVLHVDDESDQRQFSKLFLERFDESIQVASALSPDEAMIMLQEQVYDCIVSDYVMPGMNGVELARRIRETSSIPFIIYTGRGSEEVADAAFEAGVDDYIRKEMDPSHYQVLAKRIRQTVEKHRVDELYRSVVEGTRDSVRIVVGTTIVYANQAAVNLYCGDSPEELVGRDISEWLLEEDREMVTETALSRQRDEPQPTFFEFGIRRSDGEIRDVEVSASLIDFHGSPASLVITRDITKRKRMEEELRFKNLLIEAELETSPDGIVVVDKERKIISYNERFKEMWNIPEDLLETRMRDEIVRKGLKQMKDPEGFTRRTEFLYAHEHEKIHDEIELIDGRVIDRHTSPLVDFEGKYHGRVFYFRDITERKLMEEELRKSEEKYRGFIMATRDGVEVFSKTDLLFANLHAARLHGLDSVEKFMEIGPLQSVVPEDRKEIILRAQARQREEFVPPLHEFRVRLPDGSIRYLESSSSLIDYDGSEAILAFIRDITERKRMEGELRRSESEKRAILDAITDSLSLKSRDYRFLWANEATAKSIGLTADDVIGELCYEVSFGRDEPCEGCKFNQVFVTGERVVETRVMADGRIQEVVTEPVFDDLGNVVAAVESGRDITERTKMEEELRESEEKYRTFLDASRDSVVAVVDEKYVYANKLAAELLGYDDPSELIGKETIEFVAPEDRERILAMIRGRPIGEEHPIRYELKLLRKDGTKIDVENQVSLIEYERHPASLVFTRDITERKRYEDLLFSLHTHAAELAMAEDLQQACDHTLNVIESTFGYRLISFQLLEKGELKTIGARGAPITDVHLPLDGKGITVKAAREQRSILRNDLREDPDFVKGSKDSLSELAVPVIHSGKTVAVLNIESTKVGAFTEHDRMLLETLAMHVSSTIGRLRQVEILEDLVEEKTRELLDAERMAAAGSVAAMIGHDIRGPLQVINNAVYLLKKAPEKSDETLEIIMGAVRRAANMLDEFRSWTRDTPLNVVSTDLVELLNAAVRESEIPGSVDVALEVGEGLGGVSLDPLKVRRVLDNLVGNAVDAMPESGTLTVIAYRKGDDIVIKVTDTGVGIPEEEMPNLFKPFHTTKPRGLGLGLAYCKRAVEAHGGTITAESKVGGGTTFTVSLPA